MNVSINNSESDDLDDDNDRPHHVNDEDNDDDFLPTEAKEPPPTSNLTAGSSGSADSTTATFSPHGGVTTVINATRVSGIAKASSQWKNRRAHQRETNRRSKERCRRKKREQISRFRADISRLTEFTTLLQKELVECLLERQQQEEQQSNDRKLDAIGESLVHAALGAASEVLNQDQEEEEEDEDSKLPPSHISLLIASSYPPFVSSAQNDKRKLSTGLHTSSNASSAAFLSHRIGQQQVSPTSLASSAKTSSLKPKEYAFNSIITNTNNSSNNNCTSDGQLSFLLHDTLFPAALLKAQRAESSVPRPMSALASLPRDMFVASASSTASAPATLNQFQLPVPDAGGRMDALLLLRSVLQNSATSASVALYNHPNSANTNCLDNSNGISTNNSMFLLPSTSASSTMPILPNHDHQHQGMVLPSASSAMNLLLQQHQRHQQEQELLFAFLANRPPPSDRSA